MKIGFYNRLGRYEYLWELLKLEHSVSIITKEESYDVLIYGLLTVDETMVDSRSHCIVICGNATDWVKEHNTVLCLLENEEFLIKNAEVTAWGIVEILMRHSMQCLHELNVDIIGYGRCGKELIKLFDALNVNYRVIVNKNGCYEFDALYYEEYLFKKPNSWIIQTAENCIFDKYWVQRYGNSTCLIDITSKFIGTKEIQNEAVNILYAKALPDIYCSKSGAKVYYDAMMGFFVCD